MLPRSRNYDRRSGRQDVRPEMALQGTGTKRSLALPPDDKTARESGRRWIVDGKSFAQ